VVGINAVTTLNFYRFIVIAVVAVLIATMQTCKLELGSKMMIALPKNCAAPTEALSPSV